MGFFKKLVQLLLGLFSGNPVDSKQRHEIKHLENELRLTEPVLYRNGLMQPSFAEAVFILYQHTAPIEEILSSTICAPDIKLAHHYETALFMTGFTEEMRSLYADLDYEKRKAEAKTTKNEAKTYDEQRRKFELLIKKLTGEQFVKIDAIIVQLQHLNDLCKINFVSTLSLFDQNFQSANSSYKPSFQVAPLADIEKFLVAVYYVTMDFQITEGMARAVIATEGVRRHLTTEDKQIEDSLMAHLKKIQSVITRIIHPDIQLKLMRLLKGDLTLVMDKAQYSAKALSLFSSNIKETFESDLQRIKTEIQNETVATEIQKLFEYTPLQQLVGYNQEMDAFLQQNTSLAFQSTLPLKVLKSFLVIFFDERAQSLLNDVAIEGFFNNQNYKSEFSSLVYNCCDILTRIRQFENKFTREGENYDALIRSYVNDSRRDESFLQTLSKLVDSVNLEAKKLLTTNCQQLADLYKRSVEIIGDTKKSTPDYISNAKILFSSIRNRDKVEYLESQFPKWNIFFSIMYEYGIVAPPTF
jgi:hypothetical protein